MNLHWITATDSVADSVTHSSLELLELASPRLGIENNFPISWTWQLVISTTKFDRISQLFRRTWPISAIISDEKGSQKTEHETLNYNLRKNNKQEIGQSNDLNQQLIADSITWFICNSFTRVLRWSRQLNRNLLFFLFFQTKAHLVTSSLLIE